MTVISEAERQRRLSVTREAVEKGLPLAAAARALGMRPNSLVTWLRAEGAEMKRPTAPVATAILQAPPTIEAAPAPPPPEPPPEEKHDSAFWRNKANALQRDYEALSALVRELGGLDGIRLRAPTWAYAPSAGQHGSSTLIVHNSDRHYGEVIRGDEINGWNDFDTAICTRRVKRFIDAACEIGRRWTADTKVDGVLYTMAGDEISGDIHDELRETNEMTSLDQVRGAAELHVAGLRQLADEYGRVHVSAVPGNHGRSSKKPTAKRYGALSYDTMIAKMVARELAGDERISFDIAAGPDALTLIYNRPVLTTHGDKIGTGGGQGFAGPVLPIIRGANKVSLQYGSTGQRPDLILMGHFHTSAAPPGILANGSVPGYSEYGAAIRAKFDTPKQWLAVMRSRWGLAERCDIQLEDPVQPPKPRVRISQGT
jgi:transposase-like protein